MDLAGLQKFIQKLRSKPQDANIDEIIEAMESAYSLAHAGLSRSNHAVQVAELSGKLDKADGKIRELEDELANLKPRNFELEAERGLYAPLVSGIRARLKGKVALLKTSEDRRGVLTAAVDAAELKGLLKMEPDIEDEFRHSFLNEPNEVMRGPLTTKKFVDLTVFKTGGKRNG
jgi:hypothetical protein